MKHLELLVFEKRFKNFQSKVHEVNRALEKDRDVPKIIESAVPLMIHFQVSEALRSVLGEYVPNNLIQYEKKKLEELVEFAQENNGVEPNLKTLSCRLRVISRMIWQSGEGMAPFIMGKHYRPDMKTDEAT